MKWQTSKTLELMFQGYPYALTPCALLIVGYLLFASPEANIHVHNTTDAALDIEVVGAWPSCTAVPVGDSCTLRLHEGRSAEFVARHEGHEVHRLTIDVPDDERWGIFSAGVYTVGAAREYAVVTAAYGEAEPDFEHLGSNGAGFMALPPQLSVRIDGDLDERFPDELDIPEDEGGDTITRVCTYDPESGQNGCEDPGRQEKVRPWSPSALALIALSIAFVLSGLLLCLYAGLTRPADLDPRASGTARVKRSWVPLSMFASFMFCGAGQFINGRPFRGLVFLGSTFLLWFVLMGWLPHMLSITDAGALAARAPSKD